MVAPCRLVLLDEGKAAAEEDSPNMASSSSISFDWDMSLKRSSMSFLFESAETVERAGEGLGLSERGNSKGDKILAVACGSLMDTAREGLDGADSGNGVTPEIVGLSTLTGNLEVDSVAVDEEGEEIVSGKNSTLIGTCKVDGSVVVGGKGQDIAALSTLIGTCVSPDTIAADPDFSDFLSMLRDNGGPVTTDGEVSMLIGNSEVDSSVAVDREGP